MSLKIGIDVGSTHTDGVALDENNNLLTQEKFQTTPDISTGLFNTLTKVIQNLGEEKSKIRQLMIGTTHGINAIASRKGLSQVLAIRIGLPAGEGIPPLSDWPEDLREAIGDNAIMIRGGHEYTGEEIVEFDEQDLRSKLKQYAGKVDCVGITSIFSFVNPDHELRAESIVREVLGDNVSITLSNKISSLGLLERENSTILNAAIRPLMIKIILSIEEILSRLNVTDVSLYFAQNDGTVASSEFVRQYPIFTVAGPVSNSIRGAFVLTGQENAVVFDVGGATTNIGVLTNGYPRESSNSVIIGGVRTNFRMPDILAIPLAGGTVISDKVGPESVGFRLTEDAISFGGDVLTSTDIALNVLGTDLPGSDRKRVLKRHDTEFIEKTYGEMRGMWEEALDKVKTRAGDVLLITVGGGSFMLKDKLTGSSRMIRPENAQFANAIGAATALIGARVDRAYSYEAIKREVAIAEAIEQAKALSVEAGAVPSTIEVKEVEEVSMPYLPGNSVKVSVKVVGKMGQ